MRLATFALAILLVPLLVACERKIDAENVEQKQLSREFVEALRNQKGAESIMNNIFWITTYADSCAHMEPPIPKERCINIVVTGQEEASAQSNASNLELLISNFNPPEGSSLRGAHVVITPAERKKGCGNEVTPHSLSGCHVLHKQTIKQIGE